jgi:hypothetical protein
MGAPRTVAAGHSQLGGQDGAKPARRHWTRAAGIGGDSGGRLSIRGLAVAIEQGRRSGLSLCGERQGPAWAAILTVVVRRGVGGVQ